MTDENLNENPEEAPQKKTKRSGVNADVLELAQALSDECKLLVAGIDTLDGNNWLEHANKLESLNNQLQGLLVP